MKTAARVEISGAAPCAGSRIIQLRTVGGAAVRIEASRNQNSSIGKQSRCMTIARDVELACGTPGPSGRIIQIAAVEGEATTIITVVTPRDQNLATGQQRGGVLEARGVKTARVTPCPSSWVVQLDVVLREAVSRDQNLAIG